MDQDELGRLSLGGLSLSNPGELGSRCYERLAARTLDFNSSGQRRISRFAIGEFAIFCAVFSKLVLSFQRREAMGVA